MTKSNLSGVFSSNVSCLAIDIFPDEVAKELLITTSVYHCGSWAQIPTKITKYLQIPTQKENVLSITIAGNVSVAR